MISYTPLIICAAVALSALAACGGPDRSSRVTITDSAGIRIVESVAPAWEADEAWRVSGPITSVGAIDGPPESQLHRVRGVARLGDGRVVVSNQGSSEIRLYDASGRWIRSIGGEGDGPGEFRLVRGFQIVPPDTVMVFDDRGPRVTTLTVDGTIVESRTVSSPGRPYSPPDHRLSPRRWLDLVASTEIEGYQQRTNRYVTWSEDSARVDTILAHAGHEYLIYTRHQGGKYIGRGAIVVPFGGQDLTAIGPGRVALSDGQAYDIAVADLAGRERRVRRVVERRAVPPEEVARFVDGYIARYPKDRQPDVRNRFEQVKPASLMPTHAALSFDAAGNLWVENYRLPGEAQLPRMWSVFDPEGRWLGDLTLPHGLRVDEIGEAQIAGVERDSLGVEYVKVYQLIKP